VHLGKAKIRVTVIGGVLFYPVYDKAKVFRVKTPLTSVFIPTDHTKGILIKLCMFQRAAQFSGEKKI